jgi:hypothetical protein
VVSFINTPFESKDIFSVKKPKFSSKREHVGFQMTKMRNEEKFERE